MGMLKQMLRQLLGNRIVTCLHAKKTKWAMSLYGEKAVAEFDAIIRNQNSLYWLAFGTLLGAYREKGFIKNDDDIDVGMFCDDITPEVIEKLEKKGFIYEHAILTADSLYCQISFNTMEYLSIYTVSEKILTRAIA